jgi:phosphoribosylanthranilate isomerase
MPVKVKICGMTKVEDALIAAEAGADAIGFVFAEKSPRKISVADAARVSRELPQFLMRVGVFVDAPTDLVYRAMADCGLSLLQFHGDESPEYCVQFGLMCMKAFRMRDSSTLQILPAYKTDAWLLDAYSPEKPGGTGQRFDWELATEAKKLGNPIFLAGGLTPENVAEAVRTVQPFGVDVSSGVEAAPGIKDHAKVREFIKRAKEASD